MKIKVAALQMNCVLCNVDKNLTLAESLINDAVTQGAKWVVLPELFNTGYWVPKHDVELAEDIPSGRTTRWMQEQAKKHNILVSGCIMANTPNKGIITDTALTVSADGVLGTYDKIHLWDNEELRFQNGSKIPNPIDFGDLHIGMQICYEIGFPDISRIMVLNGANVIIYPAAFGRARYYVWDIQSKARALENGIYVIAVNRAGIDDDTVFLGGHSRIIAPNGEVLCEAGRDENIALVAEIDIDKCLEARRTVPYLRDINKALIKSAWEKI
ncbi:MAG: carbon-nitrogen hydrolase family protein [Phascolarctobacterium sp.]|nr:carbon-nitrogen hydrolase family protein [Phascolarctobacterium sp.]